QVQSVVAGGVIGGDGPHAVAGRRVRRTDVDGEWDILGRQVAGVGDVLCTLVEEVALFVVGEQGVEGAALGSLAGLRVDHLVEVGRRQMPVGVVIGVDGQQQLLLVVRTTGDVGNFPHLLHGGQEQADQHRDDRYHHQQLDQRKGTAPAR